MSAVTYNKERGKHRAQWTGGLEAAIAVAEDCHSRTRPSNSHWHGGDYHNAEWWGASSWPEAKQLLHAGHFPARMEKVQQTCALSLAGEPVQVCHSVQGSRVDMGRYLAGVPRCMLTWAAPLEPRQIRLIVPLGASASFSGIEARGAALCALVDHLEQAGMQVEVIGQFASNQQNGVGAKSPIQLELVAKRGGEPLAVKKLGAILATNAAGRILAFRATDATCEGVPSSYGTPATYTGPNEYIASPDVKQCGNMDYLRKWVGEMAQQIVGGDK